VLLNVEQGGLKIRIVEFVGDTETKRTELSALLDNRVHEAHHKDHSAPFLVGLHLFEEVLVNDSGESTGDTGLETLWRLSSDLDGHL